MPNADLVLEGGGVKGIALAGAVHALSEADYVFPRVAGASAGAVVASLVAALTHAGEPVSRLQEIVRGVDYRRLRDRTGLGRVPLVGPVLSLLARDGLYDGQYLEDFLTGALGELGVRTFADLRLPPGHAAADGLPASRAFALVVTVSDLSRRRLVRVPWDLPQYALDDLPVARAVRASAAIPLLFRPVRVPTQNGEATWVDGGLLSNFPIGLFDRAGGAAPRWPTFGVRLLSRPTRVPPTRRVRGPLAVGLAALDVLLTDQGNAYLDDPCTVARTVFVPTDDVSILDFGIDSATTERLRAAGERSARDFLSGWDFEAYRARCRPGLTGQA